MEGGRQGRHVLPSLRCECSLGTLRAAPPLGTTSTSTSWSTTTSTFASTHHQDKPADTPVHPSHPSTRQPHRVSSAPCHGWWRPWHGRQTNASPVVQSSPAGPVGAQMARPIISSSPSSSPPPIRIEKKKKHSALYRCLARIIAPSVFFFCRNNAQADVRARNSHEPSPHLHPPSCGGHTYENGTLRCDRLSIGPVAVLGLHQQFTRIAGHHVQLHRAVTSPGSLSSCVRWLGCPFRRRAGAAGQARHPRPGRKLLLRATKLPRSPRYDISRTRPARPPVPTVPSFFTFALRCSSSRRPGPVPIASRRGYTRSRSPRIDVPTSTLPRPLARPGIVRLVLSWPGSATATHSRPDSAPSQVEGDPWQHTAWPPLPVVDPT